MGWSVQPQRVQGWRGCLQAVGLQLTSASRSAFLLYLNVKLVPVLAFLLYGRQIAARTWASAAVAVAGTTLLSFDGTPPCAGLASLVKDGCFFAWSRSRAAFGRRSLARPRRGERVPIFQSGRYGTRSAYGSIS